MRRRGARLLVVAAAAGRRCEQARLLGGELPQKVMHMTNEARVRLSQRDCLAQKGQRSDRPRSHPRARELSHDVSTDGRHFRWLTGKQKSFSKLEGGQAGVGDEVELFELAP